MDPSRFEELVELAKRNGAWQQCSFVSYLTDEELEEANAIGEKIRLGVAEPWDVQRFRELVEEAKWREARDAPKE